MDVILQSISGKGVKVVKVLVVIHLSNIFLCMMMTFEAVWGNLFICAEPDLANSTFNSTLLHK